MSTIVAQNFGDGSGSVGVEYIMRGAFKAWTSYNQTPGTPTVRDSLNVSSLTDHGAGDATHNYVNDMASANYALIFYGGKEISTHTQRGQGWNVRGAPVAASARVVTVNSGAGTAEDQEHVNLYIAGDLA